MNHNELVDEVQARGFDMVSDARASRFVNFAYHSLCEAALWPFLEESATGPAPLAITDLRTIEQVIVTTDRNRELLPATYQWLVATFGDLSDDGRPEWYYVANPSGTLMVATYPESSETIGVQYWETPPDLSGTDTPVVPSRYHDIIVDMAVEQAYRDGDNHQAAEALAAHVERRVAQMRNALLTQQIQGPELMIVRGESLDW